MVAGLGRIGVVGAGLIGGSIAKAAAEVSPADVVVADASASTRAALGARGFRVVGDAAAVARAVDVAFVAVPPTATAGVVAEMLQASGSVVVSDTASVKRAVWERVAAIAPPQALPRYVPGHPLAGRESYGWENSTADLVRGAVWAVCPDAERTDADATIAVMAAITAMHARVLAIGAGDHDSALAYTSHMPHLAASALARAVADDSPAQRFRLSGGSLRDATRVAAASSQLWGDILRQNGPNIVRALDDFVAELRNYRDMVADERWDDLAAAWREGAAAREHLRAARWSHERPVEDVSCPRTVGALLGLGREGRLIHSVARSGAGLRVGVSHP